MTLAELGQYLREQREAKGLSLVEVSEKTKISARLLSHIEKGNSKFLPHAVYAKSFVNAYASLLGVNDAEFQAALETVFPHQEEESIQAEPGLLVGGGRMDSDLVRKLLFLLVFLVLLAAVIGGGWFVVSTFGSDIAELVKKPFVASVEPAVIHANSTESFAATPEPATEENDLVITLSPQFNQNASAQNSTDVENTPLSGSIVDEDPASDEILSEPATHTVTIDITRDRCWVAWRIDGEKEKSKTFKAGEQESFTYAESLQLTLGNPAVVTVLQDGKEYPRRIIGNSREVLRFP